MADRRACKAIGDFRAYAAVTAYHACHEYLRRQCPQHHRLKNRLRYLLTHHPGFALWADGETTLLCGFGAWREAERGSVRSARLEQLSREPQSFAEAALDGRRAELMNPADLLAALFNWVGHPLELDDLVNIVAALCGIVEQKVVSETADEQTPDMFERLADPRADVAAEVERRLHLQRLWAEIAQLPLAQRAALLLNLRDEKGGNATALLTLTGVASIRQIAETLEMEAPELARLWPRLPLNDDAVAERLGLTRQQVINLRLAARRRLVRRMKASGETASIV